MKNLFSFLPAIVLATAGCLSPLHLFAQTGWLRHFSAADTLIGIGTLPDGYAFFAHNATEAYQIRTDLAGATLDSLPLGAVPADLIPAAGGGFFKSFLENGQVRLEKLDGGGALLWEQMLPGTANQISVALAARPDGGCFVVSASVPVASDTAPNIFPKTIVQKIAADGSLDWLRIGDPLFWMSGKRIIEDALALPDGSCLVLSYDTYYSQKAGSRLVQITPDGVFGQGLDFAPAGAYLSYNRLNTVRPAPDGALIGIGILRAIDIYVDAHIGHTNRIEPGALPALETLDYPVVEQIWHGPLNTVQPWASAPLPGGDMLVIEKEKAKARLWRGSWDLQDTAWVRPLTPQGGFFPEKTKRLNRLVYATADEGALVGGVDSAGIFLQKIDYWGNDSTAGYWPAGVRVWQDLDMDCATPGPYAPLPGAAVRLSSPDNPELRWLSKADSSGRVNAYVPPGLWRAELADSVAVIFGKNCLADTVLVVADSLPAPEATLSVLRYSARLSGRVWWDANGNCLPDENGPGFDQLRLIRGDQTYEIPTDADGFFSVPVDTGAYRLQAGGNRPGPLRGFYCGPDSVYLPDYQSADTVELFWRKWQNSKLRVKIRRDANYDCLYNAGDENWAGLAVRATDPAMPWSNAQAFTDPAGWAEIAVSGPGDVSVKIESAFPDSLLCAPGAPHAVHFAAGPDNAVVADTFRAFYPRWHDTLYVCAGEVVWGVLIVEPEVIAQPAVFLSQFQVPFYHHVFPWPAYWTELFEPLPPGQTDTLATFQLQTIHGCDSTVVVHYTTATGAPASAIAGLRVLPNPARERATVFFPGPDYNQLIVTDLAGRKIKAFDLLGGQPDFAIDCRQIPPGLYVLAARREDGVWVFGKLSIP